MKHIMPWFNNGACGNPECCGSNFNFESETPICETEPHRFTEIEFVSTQSVIESECEACNKTQTERKIKVEDAWE